MLPSAIAPPIQTIASRRSRTSGWRSSRSATFVSGPVGTSTTPGSITLGEQVGGMRVERPCRGSGSAGPSRPDSPWTCAAVRSLPPSGASAPAATGTSRAPGELEHVERVARRLVERLVAGDGRDRAQLDLGRGEREQDRDRVVVAGVAVDDDRACSQAARPPRRRSGSDAARRAGRRRARPRRRRGGAPRAVAALEQRDDEAGGEGVAGGGAVDGFDRRRRRRARPPPRPRAARRPRRRA